MLVGYVSDERYIAQSDLQLEFVDDSGSVEARSLASGAVSRLPVHGLLVVVTRGMDL